MYLRCYDVVVETRRRVQLVATVNVDSERIFRGVRLVNRMVLWLREDSVDHNHIKAIVVVVYRVVRVEVCNRGRFWFVTFALEKVVTRGFQVEFFQIEKIDFIYLGLHMKNRVVVVISSRRSDI